MEIDIRHIAKLARLNITDEELPRFEKEMADIVGMVENLPDLPDSGALIDPDHPMTMRQDEAENTFRRDELLKNAPQVQAGCVVVPRIVE